MCIYGTDQRASGYRQRHERKRDFSIPLLAFIANLREKNDYFGWSNFSAAVRPFRRQTVDARRTIGGVTSPVKLVLRRKVSSPLFSVCAASFFAEIPAIRFNRGTRSARFSVSSGQPSFRTFVRSLHVHSIFRSRGIKARNVCKPAAAKPLRPVFSGPTFRLGDRT